MLITIYVNKFLPIWKQLKLKKLDKLNIEVHDDDQDERLQDEQVISLILIHW